ncbi:ATP-binding cassette domain-containing protein [Rufibacter sediminis]|uniref:ATP-binding cassette domain-containing protein n=1 Tax=Rufibacter sediminis TaxID=2762756 RepID=A0ABR6VPR7_9BACT|nr:ATP-binding cassette domain-containing protein [Rufibacter sediminis]MBC3538596.1 ATP-binding cassette domain-containing protein [Rufibacter sediminis]
MFLSLQHVTVRHLQHIIFQDLSFQVNKGEQWALVGESGSGKTSLLQAIAGKLNVTGGQIDYGFYHEFLQTQAITDPFFTFKDLIAEVGQKHSFRNFSSNTSTFYYQQRYHAADAEDAPTVEDYLASVDTPLDRTSDWSLSQVIEVFQLEKLLPKELIKLSNGETKRLLFAAALLRHPKLLLLDMPLTGLDVTTREDFHRILAQIAASGITIIMATAEQEIPDFVTHVATLRQGNLISAQPKEAYQPDLAGAASGASVDVAALQNLLSGEALPVFETMVGLKEVSVQYGEKKVLDKVSWHVAQGERWAVLGPNGAGKTTLLSLLNGDNPQAFSKDITLFDRKRGTGETIWDIKKKIGFVSPELFQYFPYQQTCLQVVESGLYDTLGLFRKSDPQNAARARQWLDLFGIAQEAGKSLRLASASTQRLCLLARALIKHPPLLILDEPCQGMDAQQQHRFKQIIEALCANSATTLLYVTHYLQEIPDCVTRVLQLEQGRAQEKV